jgi:Rrf2 family cysteine metabolism transcriptional repressor
MESDIFYYTYGDTLIKEKGFMKLTTRSEYALLALLFLARHYSEEYKTVETVAAAQGIPRKYLEQIMLALKRGRYVRSSKGQHGGYRLAKPPAAVTLAEIVRLFDGALAPTDSVSEYFYESTPVEKEKKLVSLFKDIRDYAAKKLETTTLADVS